MRATIRRLATAALLTLLVLGNGSVTGQVRAGPVGPLDQAFAAASQQYGVPQSLLVAISYAETGWNASYASAETGEGVYGPMALYDTANHQGTLEQAAADLSVSQPQLESDPATNIMGAAAVLADGARATNQGNTPSSVNEWYGAVAQYSGIRYRRPAKEFADYIFALLAKGVKGRASDGEVLGIPATVVDPDTSQLSILNLTHLQPQQGDYPYDGAFIPAGGTGFGGSNRPKNGLFIQYVVVHDTEGGYPSVIQAFTEPGDCCSAHYTIDGESNVPYPAVTQFVFNHDIAYHAGNYWFNQHSIGIEHVGFADQRAGYYTQALYDASAKLVAYTAAVYGIPIDRAHILGHGSVPAPFQSLTHYMHWDPGPFWDWPYYLAQVKADYATWTHNASLPSPSVPGSDQAASSSIRLINVGGDESAASDIQDWRNGPAVNFANVHADNNGTPSDQLVRGASDPSTWVSPSNYNADDFACDNLPNATRSPGGSWTEDANSDLRAKAEYGEAFARIGTYTDSGGVTWDEIDFNGVTGWIKESDTTDGWGVTVTFKDTASTPIYGKPLSTASPICPGTNLTGQSYVSQNVYTDASGATWYEIFYNHRVAWVPASELTVG